MAEERSNAEWIRALKQNEASALDALWTLLNRRAVYLALRYGRDTVAAEKAALGAYERILQRGIYLYRFKCRFLWYCRQILAHEVLRQPIDREIPTPPEDLPPPLTTLNEITPSSLDIWEKIQGCFGQLTERQTAVIEMRYISSLCPQAVAERLHITRNNVNKVAYDARKKLKNCLSRLGYTSASDFF